MDQSWGTRDQVVESVSVSRSIVLAHYARGSVHDEVSADLLY